MGSKRESEPCALTIVERKNRNSIWIKAENHTADAIQAALKQVLAGFGDRTKLVFRSITGDNGSEFAALSELKNKA